jgi:hypothetical protein
MIRRWSAGRDPTCRPQSVYRHEFAPNLAAARLAGFEEKASFSDSYTVAAERIGELEETRRESPPGTTVQSVMS